MSEEILKSWRNRFIEWLQVHWIHEDSAHDIYHLHRVWRNCQHINSGEGDKGDLLILLTAAYFHDLVTTPKNHSSRELASLLGAEKTADILNQIFEDFPREKIIGVSHAIHAHSFSANIETNTIEAKILQDADRIEALGATGIARLFYTAGKMNGLLYNADDPLGLHRKLDDKNFALDHIEVKLL
ncbi:HD domain-containing protein [Flavitalea sp.]|nr:HD domain-containing protein [Flavitalea sp.]